MTAPAIEKYVFETGNYRPPSEGGSYSLLVRFTRNCPWNHCTFCGMYKHERFEVRSAAEIRRDIDAMAALCADLGVVPARHGRGGAVTREAAVALLGRVPQLNDHQGFAMIYHWLLSGARTAFIQDANSLIMKTDDLVEALGHLRRTFPSIERVTAYARSKTLARKTLEELRAIREAGLDRLHVGLETGDNDLLRDIRKGATAEIHIMGGQKALQAGFTLSEYWMPGLGGTARWEAHARNTARVLNAIEPHYIRSRPFYPWAGTPLAQAVASGRMVPLDPRGQLLELKTTIEELEVHSRVCFDHAGNYWRNRQGGLLFTQSYEGYRFPDEKADVLALIEEGLEAGTDRPAFLRM